MPKIIRILSKDHVPWRYFVNFITINKSKLKFCLVICIAKHLIWTTLKIFSVLWFFASSDSRFSNSCISAKYCQILTNHASMESLLIQISDDVSISMSKNWHLRLVLWCRVTYFVYTLQCYARSYLSLSISQTTYCINCGPVNGNKESYFKIAIVWI